MTTPANSALVDLPSPPADAISHVAFSPALDSTLLLASAWDKSVRLYDTQSLSLANTVYLPYPVTKAVWAGPSHSTTVYSITIDGSVHSIDLTTNSITAIGQHSSGLTCLVACPHDQLIYTGGWDGTLRAWDPRSPSPCISASDQKAKILALDLIPHHPSLASATTTTSTTTPMLVLATIANKVFVYDRRNLYETLQHRESQLRHMTRTLVCTPDGEGFAMASTEGRIAVEYFDTSDAAISRRFAFKCHRQQVQGVEHVYPVNALAFHPKHTMTFASGGGDGVVGIWDGIKKKRIRALPRQATSISSLSFSNAGDKLAVAVSYTYEQGEKEHPPDAIFIRNIQDSDVQPRK